MTPHEPYIARVVRALTAAGITVSAWRAERHEHEPLDAAIALPHEDTLLWLGWDEETGWHYGPDTDTPHDDGGVRMLDVLTRPCDAGLEWARWLDVDLLADPAVVVYAVRKCVLGDEPGLEDAPRYRGPGVGDGDRFLADLLAAGGDR